MYQANQKAVIQSANQNLVSIRQSEIQYYAEFFTNFGTQCSLIAGILVGSISQTPQLEAKCHYFWVVIYSSSFTICLCLTLHVLIATVILVLYGQGLAIRGPIGSMVKVVEGMVQEQHKIVGYFIASMVTFLGSMVGMYFIMMDEEVAYFTLIMTILSSLYTYQCALRIYNRFRWDEKKSGWKSDTKVDVEEEIHEMHPVLLNELLASGYSTVDIATAYRTVQDAGLMNESDNHEKKKTVMIEWLSNENNDDTSTKKPVPAKEKTLLKGRKNSLFSWMSQGKQKDTENEGSDYSDTNSVDQRSVRSDSFSSTGSSSGDVRNVLHMRTFVSGNTSERDSVVSTSTVSSSISSSILSGNGMNGGYLSLKNDNKRNFRGQDVYERFYFLLRGSSIYYFKDKLTFQKDPTNTVNKRPIDLEGYTLVADSIKPPFRLVLAPVDTADIRKVWKFRCDTDAEYAHWKQVFTEAIPKD